jgi:hypothetical protein
MIRHLEIENIYELHETVVVRVKVDVRDRSEFDSDEDFEEYLYDTIYPLTGVGYEDGNSAYFVKSIDDLEPAIEEEYGL